MSSIENLIKEAGLTDQSGKDQVEAAEKVRQSFLGVSQENKEMFKASRELRRALDQATRQALANIATTKKLLKQDRISSNTANDAIQRQVKNLDSLTSAIQKEQKERELGVADLKKFRKATVELGESLQEEKKFISARQKGQLALLKEMKLQTKAWAKSQGEAARSLATQLEDKLGNTYAGAALIAGGRGMVERRGKKGLAAAAGIGIGAALVHKAGKLQTRALDTLQGRAANYGFELKDVNKELALYSTLIAKVRIEARELGHDADAAQAAMGALTAQTGVQSEGAQKAIMGMLSLVTNGVATLDELNQDLVYQINSVGLGAEDAKGLIMDVNAVARKSSVQMDDFYKSIKDVTGAVGGLTSDQKDLAKTMGTLIKQSDKLGLSYDRRIKAAQGLTQALTASYDAGFATVEVGQDLEMAMKSSNKTLARDAQRIQALRKDGTITDSTAARMFKEAGGTTDKSVLSERLRKSAIDVAQGRGEFVQARLGTEVSVDQMEMLRQLGKDILSGKTTGVEGTKQGKDLMAQFTEQVREKRRTTASTAQEAIENLENTILQRMVPLLEIAASALKNISWTVDKIGGWFGKSTAQLKKERDADLRESKIEDGKETLVATLEHFGEKRGVMQGDDAYIRKLAKDEGLQKDFRKKARLREPEQLALREVLKGHYSDSQIEELFKKLDRNYVEPSSGSGTPVPTSVSIQSSKMTPSGSREGSAVVTFTEGNAVEQQRQQAASQAAEARALGRQGNRY